MNKINNKQQIIARAKATLGQTIEALQALNEQIDGNFVAAVQAMQNCKGRIIVTGMGKSAIIAQKMVATLNSTGTLANFLHAADALHGDLGMIHAEDVVLAISKSGETRELIDLGRFVKSRQNQLLVMCSQPTSNLAKIADTLLFIPILQEGDLHNLAPTSSTSAQLALGDALAICLSELKQFQVEDFGHIHPAGMLGKRLLLRVQDILTGEKPFVFADATVGQVILEISSKRLGATAVLNIKNELIGVITDGDLRRMLEFSANQSELTAADIMGKNPKRIAAIALVQDALEIMEQHKISQLVVQNSVGKYLGILHLHDILKEGFR